MSSIDEVRERLSIEQVVGEVVALKRAGSVYKGLCPFHNEKTPSFIVTPSRGRYHCFGCAADGDIFNFVMAQQKVEFHEALHMLAAKAGVTVEDPRDAALAGGIEARIHDMNAVATTYYQAMLAAAAGARARAYLERRHISATTIDRFGLGFAPDARDALYRRLREQGYADDEIVAAGLAVAPDEGGPPRDRFRNRIIFPIRDAKGRILGFGGRVMDDGQPKYLNSPATPAFEKSRVLYTIEYAADSIRGSREGVIVEGYMDALRAHQEGFPNVVATLGTAITEHQLRALARLTTRVVLALDADAAGQKAAVRAGLAALHAYNATLKPVETSTLGGARREPVQVYVATLPDGQDPDDAIAADPEIWRQAVSRAAPLLDHYFALVEAGLDRSRPEWRQEAIDALIPVIGQVHGLGLQQTYIERLSALTGIDARYLRENTPGKLQPPATRPRERRRPVAEPAAAVDPVRVTEEYLLGLLLANQPLPADVQAELAAFAPATAELAPLFYAVKEARAPDAQDDDLAERLIAAIEQHPPVAPDHLQGVVRNCLLRIAGERQRRELISLGHVVTEADHATVRELDQRAIEIMALKEKLAGRLQQEQAYYYRRQPSTSDEGDLAAH
jgi:DNA primase